MRNAAYNSIVSDEIGLCINAGACKPPYRSDLAVIRYTKARARTRELPGTGSADLKWPRSGDRLANSRRTHGARDRPQAGSGIMRTDGTTAKCRSGHQLVPLMIDRRQAFMRVSFVFRHGD